MNDELQKICPMLHFLGKYAKKFAAYKKCESSCKIRGELFFALDSLHSYMYDTSDCFNIWDEK